MLIKKIGSFIKIEHSIFSLPILLAGAFLGKGEFPGFDLIVYVLLAGASARIVAMSLNRIIDREIDSRNPRTKDRHLAAGTLKLVEAWAAVILSLLVYLLAVWLISDFVLKLSWIPILAFAAYPYFKRFTRWAHVGLGLVWSLVPLSGYLAVTNSFFGPTSIYVLSAFCVFWLAGFDIIYATTDEEFDRVEGLYSVPASFGSRKALIIASVFHLISFLILMTLYLFWFSGPLTLIILLVCGALLYLEQVYSEEVDLAFFKINAVIGFVVLLFVISGIKGY